MTKPPDTDTIVYVAVARELLPSLRETSEPVRLRVVEEEDGVLVLELTTEWTGRL